LDQKSANLADFLFSSQQNLLTAFFHFPEAQFIDPLCLAGRQSPTVMNMQLAMFFMSYI
jgi:hypothetical protein